MTYKITLTDGSTYAVIPDGTLNTQSSMTLIGQNYIGAYGLFQNDNFIRLLENGANPTQPAAPLTGQLWFNTTTKTLQVYNGTTFKTVGGAIPSSVPPTSNAIGDLWFNTTTNQLYVYSATGLGPTTPGFVFVGPTGGTNTGAIDLVVQDTSNVNHNLISLQVNGNIVGLVSDDATFTPANTISGFGNVYPGITLSANVNSQTPVLTGTATNALALNGLPSSAYMSAVTNTSTTGTIQINNSNGLTIASSTNQFVANINANSTFLTNEFLGGSITLAVNHNNVLTPVLAVNAVGPAVGPSITVAGDISATGDIWGTAFIGDGGQLANINGANITGLPPSTYNNSNVAAYLSSGNVSTNILTTANISASGNIQGNVHIGNGAGLTNIVGSAVVGAVGSANTAAIVTNAAQPNIKSVGTLTSLSVAGNLIVTGNANVQGNLTYNNINNLFTDNLVLGLANNQVGFNANGAGIVVGITNEAQLLYCQSNKTWNSNIDISSSGNIQGNIIFGNAAGLTNIVGSAVVGTVGSANTAATVTNASQPIITSVGKLANLYVIGNTTVSDVLASGNISVVGNIQGSYFIGNGSQLTGISSGATGLGGIAVFTGGAAGNWTVPAGVTTVKATVIGGGGGGSAATVGATYATLGSGGQAGGMSIAYLTVTPGSAIQYNTGAGGGAASVNTIAGSNGGTSTVVYGGTTITAYGGAGGAPSSSSICSGQLPAAQGGGFGAAGGGSSGGVINNRGAEGENGILVLVNPGFSASNSLRLPGGYGGQTIYGTSNAGNQSIFGAGGVGQGIYWNSSAIAVVDATCTATAGGYGAVIFEY